MPLPKRRHSPTRGKKRRTNWKISAPRVETCDCGEAKLPHHVCPSCGEYKGKKILNKTEA
ncbi:50S ribosomal protein L32 [candidate division GN15 bacterium]|nr:50S ribosomal protein L32 [candidate division GN15 bacterium]